MWFIKKQQNKSHNGLTYPIYPGLLLTTHWFNKHQLTNWHICQALFQDGDTGNLSEQNRQSYCSHWASILVEEAGNGYVNIYFQAVITPQRKGKWHVEFGIKVRRGGRGSFKGGRSREIFSEMTCLGDQRKVFQAEKIAGTRPWGRTGLCVLEESQRGCSRVSVGKWPELRDRDHAEFCWL